MQRWRKGASEGETILTNTSCCGIALDNEDSLYVVDWILFRVMKWQVGVGEMVAEGNGQGSNINQLNNPIGLFLDENRTLYVVDRSNFCVTKWEVGVKESTVVAGGNGQDANLNQLNNRVMKWSKGATIVMTICTYQMTAISVCKSLCVKVSCFVKLA